MKKIIIIALLVSQTGCLVQDQGSTETTGNPVTTPPDFNVISENPPQPPTGGDNNTQPPEPFPAEEGFVINNGALKTNQDSLSLQLITFMRFQMKITSSRDCSGGDWETWAAQKQIPVTARNGMNLVSVQYRDWDGNISHCYRNTIVHDDLGPQILFTKYPLAQLEEGITSELVAEINDSVGTVSEARCKMVGIEKPCFPGRNEVSIAPLPVGDYEFQITAKDDLGNEGVASVKWSVVSLTRKLSQNILVNNYKKVDILMVIDNSGSMRYEQQSMASRTGNLLSVLRGLDYRIAITTTDPTNVALGDGRFIQINGAPAGEYFIDSTLSQTTAQQRLSSTLQRPETGSGSEQGIRSAYRVIERYKAQENPAKNFFREGSQFAVVVISDEDESDNTPKNDPQNLIKLVGDTFAGQKMFGFHSIITRPGDTSCRSTQGYAYGDRYKMMSDLTGGVVGSVCEMDYSSQVTGIAEGIRSLLKTMTLQCAPLPEKGIKILKAGVEVSLSYQIDGVNLKFMNELDPAQYTIEYSCLK